MGDFDPIVAEAAPPKHGRRVWRALVVGITGYDEPTLADNMQFCSEAARNLAEQLEASGYQVRQLHDHPGADGRPTLAAVRRELHDLTEKADGNDTVLFYFGGHGMIDDHDDRPKLLMADTRVREDRYLGGVLTIADLLKDLRGRSRYTVVLLDACHMGLGLDPELAASTREVATREQAGGFALLSGSTSDDVSQDSTTGPLAGGAFTLALLAALKGGATDHDGGVRFSSLAKFVQDDVAHWTRSQEGKDVNARQRPVLRLEVADVQVVPPPRGYRDLTPPPAAGITCAQFTADGRSLVTGGADGAVYVWDASTCTPLLGPFVHRAAIATVVFSEDGTEVGTVTSEGRSMRWPLTGGEATEMMRLKKRRGEVNCADWSEDGFMRAVATTEGLYREAFVNSSEFYVDVAMPEMITRFGRGGAAYHAAAFVPGSTMMVSGGADGSVCLWNDDPAEPMTTHTLDGAVLTVDTSKRDDLFAAGGTGGARVWNIYTNEAVDLRGHGGPVTDLAFSDDSRRIATACADGLVRVFDARTGKLVRTLRLGRAGASVEPSAVCFSPDGRHLFAGYRDGRGRRYDLDT